MKTFRLDDAARFAALLRGADGDFIEGRIRELIRDCLPPFYHATGMGPEGETKAGVEWLVERVARAVRVEARALGRILAGGTEDAPAGVAAFARRFRASCHLWVLGFRPFGELAADTDPDLGEVAAELHAAHGGPTGRYHVRALLGSRGLFAAVIRHLGPVREAGGKPFRGCTVEEIPSPVTVPAGSAILLNRGHVLGGPARLGGTAVLVNARVRVTVTANAGYFAGDWRAALPDWERALRAAEGWARRLLPAPLTAELAVVVDHEQAYKLAGERRGSDGPPTGFALNRGARLKPAAPSAAP